METVTTLDDKVRAFKVLLDKKDELAEQTKANNQADGTGRSRKRCDRILRF